MVDAMYFHAARQSYENAVSLKAPIDRVQENHDRLTQYYYRLEEIRDKKLNDDWDEEDEEDEDTCLDANALFDKLESVAIQLENTNHDVGVAYGPFLQALATVHILSTASLESHINNRAKDFLDGRMLDQFERISLEAKWLMLPKMIGATGFDPGAQPYQSFSKLITLRNELVHYKGREEEWSSDLPAPTFLEKIGLTLKDAKQSVDAVKGMVESFANQIKQAPPYWIRASQISYFDFSIEIKLHPGNAQAQKKKGTKKKSSRLSRRR